MSWSRRVKHSSDLHGSLKLDTWSGKSWILCYKILFLKAGLCLRWVPWTLLFRVVVSSLLYPHLFSIHKLNINRSLKRPLEVAVSNLIWKSKWKKNHQASLAGTQSYFCLLRLGSLFWQYGKRSRENWIYRTIKWDFSRWRYAWEAWETSISLISRTECFHLKLFLIEEKVPEIRTIAIGNWKSKR